MKKIKSVMQKFVFVSILAFVLFHNLYSQGSWSPIFRQTSGDLLSVFFTSSDRGYIGGDDGYFAFTTDGGINWTKQSLNTSDSINEIYFRNDDNGYILVGKRIFITKDGGKSWLENKILNSTEYVELIPEFLSVRFADKKKGWIVGALTNKNEEVVDSLVLHTVDSGETWQRVYIPSDKKELYDLDITNDIGWIVGDGGLILKTDDDGRTWTKQNSGTELSLYNVDFRDKKNGIVVGSKGTILRTENGGQTWERINSAATKSLLRVNFINDKTGWIVGSDGLILRTDDKGKSWYSQKAQTSDSLYGLYTDKKIGFAVGRNGIILKFVK